MKRVSTPNSLRSPCKQVFLIDQNHTWYVIVYIGNVHYRIVGEPKSRIVQKHTFFAPERYTAGILYTDSLNSA